MCRVLPKSVGRTQPFGHPVSTREPFLPFFQTLSFASGRLLKSASKQDFRYFYPEAFPQNHLAAAEKTKGRFNDKNKSVKKVSNNRTAFILLKGFPNNQGSDILAFKRGRKNLKHF